MAKKNKSGTGGIVYSTNPDFAFEQESGEQETLPPAQQMLQVKLDTKHRAGKVVTTVAGFTGKSADLETLGRQLKTYCGTGGSVKDGLIIIQGDCRTKITGMLRKAGYGVKTV
ncbi:translation initiation factor [Compostibacter hankyongensis]|uniref:Translation initiation factor n=1 Tax=Compostibacter hankyongensis TaxID=1007089 RepID=A0ABP8FSN9_9BACT